MFSLRLELVKKMLRANNCEFRGTISGGPQEVVLFRYCQYDMAMRVGEMTETSIRKHIEAKIAAFMVPMVERRFFESTADQIVKALERMIQ